MNLLILYFLTNFLVAGLCGAQGSLEPQADALPFVPLLGGSLPDLIKRPAPLPQVAAENSPMAADTTQQEAIRENSKTVSGADSSAIKVDAVVDDNSESVDTAAAVVPSAEETVSPDAADTSESEGAPGDETAVIPKEVTIAEIAPADIPLHDPLALVSLQEQEMLMREQAKKNEAIDQQSSLDRMVYLGSYVEPWRYVPDELLEFIFDNAEISAFVAYVSEKFNLTFILDDAIKPLPQGGKSLMGSKISFKTHVPMNKRQVWDLFVMFLDMAGLAAVPGPGERVYRITSSKDPKQPNDAIRGPIPTFIGIDHSLIPDNDTLIRYIYFRNVMPLNAISTVIDTLKSPAAPHAVPIPELQCVMITDRAINVRMLLTVIRELDQIDAQEGLAVIKLEHADAIKAAKLYADFAKPDAAQGMAARLLGSRKSPTNEYFPRGARVIPEPRRNLLIVLGSRSAIETITDFVRTVIERQDDRSDAPRYIVALKHLDAENLAAILTESLKFKEDSDAVRNGGVRDGDKYIKPVSIVPEPTTNSLIIGADYEDFSKINALIQSIDIEQPQVGLRLFVLSITNSDNTGFGVQMRNKVPGPNGLIGDNVSYQTTNLAELGSGLVENNVGGGAARLLGNILNIASGVPVGSTVVALGSDAFGVWGLLNMLQTYTKSEVVANPFLVTTNKFPAQLKLGEIRRVADATVFTTVSATAFQDLPAILNISITPQISVDGLISLDVFFELDQFTDPNVNSSNGNRTVRKIETSVIVGDNEVLALGGLIRKSVTESESKVPVLGDIPLFGWLFKNRTRSITDTSLLLLIQAEIIHPVAHNKSARLLTEQQLHDAKALADDLRMARGIQDPVNRLLFNDREKVEEQFIDRFMEDRNKYATQENSAETKDQLLVAPDAQQKKVPMRSKNKKKQYALRDCNAKPCAAMPQRPTVPQSTVAARPVTMPAVPVAVTSVDNDILSLMSDDKEDAS